MLLVVQPFAVVATSLVAILVARELSTDDWARFSAFLGLAFGFAILIDIGLSTWLLRELSRIAARPDEDVGRVGALLANAATFSLGAATAIALVSIVVATAVGTSASCDTDDRPVHRLHRGSRDGVGV